MKSRQFPWQRNLNRVPTDILARARQLQSDLLVVAETKRVLLDDIAKDVYRHVGLIARDGVLTVAEPVFPSAEMGKWSARNREGWERTRYDLPKITKTYSWDTPNFGDAGTYGTHTHYRDREVYQVEISEARGYRLGAEVLNTPGAGGSSALVKFFLHVQLDRTRPDFEAELLWCLNILQENCGVANVYASNATREDYIGSIALDWEIFPHGTAEQVIAAIKRSRGSDNGERDTIMADRIKLFATLKPKAFLRGRGGFSTYVGAQFADDLVVFENTTYGNALYVLYDNWEEISKRSRLDLLKGTSARFDRFQHRDGWKERFLTHMEDQLTSCSMDSLV